MVAAEYKHLEIALPDDVMQQSSSSSAFCGGRHLFFFLKKRKTEKEKSFPDVSQESKLS